VGTVPRRSEATVTERAVGTVTELEMRLGRSLLSFGPCLAFAPANPYRPKDAFDPRASQLGLDGLFLRLVLPLVSGGRASAPAVEIRTAFLLPSPGFLPVVELPTAEWPPDLGDSSVHGRLGLFVPGDSPFGTIELGLSGDLHRVAVEGGEEWDAGVWFVSELAGFVLGAEGAIRSSGYGYAFSLNRRLGDFFALAEAGHEDADGAWRIFGRLSWAREDYELSLSALVDSETLATRAALSAARNFGEAFELGATLGWNRLPENWVPALPADWTAGLTLECFF
jgi:hypothetical protein